jgi:hypothetical protein
MENMVANPTTALLPYQKLYIKARKAFEIGETSRSLGPVRQAVE